jgi:N6-adenosine-specific RNA methylase IME4
MILLGNFYMKKYNIIYADPPWAFNTYNDKGKEKSPDKHYKCMGITSIQNLDIKNICDDNCVLLMWVTFPCLEQAFSVIKSWGFTYKTNAFTWVKKNKKSDSLFWGMGYYTRSNAEICLLATKGKPLKRISKSVHSVIISNIEHHSKKPDDIRNRIVSLFGDIPRIELFARSKTDGWDVFGNEVDSDIDL